VWGLIWFGGFQNGSAFVFVELIIFSFVVNKNPKNSGLS
jgi:hypothetical protein